MSVFTTCVLPGRVCATIVRTAGVTSRRAQLAPVKRLRSSGVGATPAKRISPLTLPPCRRPASTSSSVVLPAPEGPISAVSSPDAKSPPTSYHCEGARRKQTPRAAFVKLACAAMLNRGQRADLRSFRRLKRRLHDENRIKEPTSLRIVLRAPPPPGGGSATKERFVNAIDGANASGAAAAPPPKPPHPSIWSSTSPRSMPDAVAVAARRAHWVGVSSSAAQQSMVLSDITTLRELQHVAADRGEVR